MRGALVSLSSSLPLLWPQTNELESLVSFHFPKQTDNPRLKRLSVKTFKGSVDFAKCHKPSFLNCGQRSAAHRRFPSLGEQFDYCGQRISLNDRQIWVVDVWIVGGRGSAGPGSVRGHHRPSIVQSRVGRTQFMLTTTTMIMMMKEYDSYHRV